MGFFLSFLDIWLWMLVSLRYARYMEPQLLPLKALDL